MGLVCVAASLTALSITACNPVSSSRASGTAIPAGTYSGSIKATLTTQMHLNLPGASSPDAGGGTEALKRG